MMREIRINLREIFGKLDRNFRKHVETLETFRKKILLY